jgi:hypothetical protein
MALHNAQLCDTGRVFELRQPRQANSRLPKGCFLSPLLSRQHLRPAKRHPHSKDNFAGSVLGQGNDGVDEGSECRKKHECAACN